MRHLFRLQRVDRVVRQRASEDVHGELPRGIQSADPAAVSAQRVLEDVGSEDENRAFVASRRRVADAVGLARAEDERRVRVDDGRVASTANNEDAAPWHHDLRLAVPLLLAEGRARGSARDVGDANERAVEEKRRTSFTHARYSSGQPTAGRVRKWSQRDSNP